MIVFGLILLILLVLLAIVFFFIAFGVVKVMVDGRVINMNIEFNVSVRFCGLRLLKIEWPDNDMVHGSSLVQWFQRFMEKSEIAEQIEKRSIHTILGGIKDLMQHEKWPKEIEQLTIKSLRLSHIYWYSTVGLGEADRTAVSVGILWALKSNLLSTMNRVLKGKMTKPVLQVHPDYSEKLGFRTHFKCMIRFRLGHAISKALKIVKDKKRRQETCQKNIQYKV
ncbi:hypothetical protein GCM10011391_33730 [Pullulanibacillus camelliae]|uniref:DUF2953 domain-containing protein n=1 Tax=Pullulanibacillus camelliae TaxID=1707096 RepID=A0A8J3DZW3_9BACL|nr:DUF2953 domain-containing protein [Pullulanibacillus camelliae]GGE52158.1 hypothetical protein GCM10011391_33730 [Pullulanibacillus camelliae]